MAFLRCVMFLCLVSMAFCQDCMDVELDLLPRPLIMEYTETQFKNITEELTMQCMSWRVAGESNNLGPWKTIPMECADYVQEYMSGRAYNCDLETVSKEARVYAKSLELGDDEMDAWVFDIDETLLSNLPYYSDHGFGLEVFNCAQFDRWVLEGVAPVIKPSLKLYEDVSMLGVNIILLTGRSEDKRNVTTINLMNAGYYRWDKLILRGDEDQGKSAVEFKSEKRKEIIEEGYRIIGNSGDQWSDLMGTCVASRSFKLSNPMYHIP